MDAQPQTRIGMPMDEFIRQYDEAPFELVDGERIPLALQVAGQAYVVSALAEAFFLYERHAAQATVFLHLPFVQIDDAGWVIASRTPKIALYDTRRWLDNRSRDADWRHKPLLLAPDLCIEVLSPNENTPDLSEKASAYLNDGVRLVWVVNTRQQFVTVHSHEHTIRLTEADTLDGGSVLPEFSVAVAAIFNPS